MDTIHGEQLRDKLSILQGLVFELRRGVKDLQFHLELNNEKIGLFLQLLSTLQAVIHTDASGATSMHAAANDTGNVRKDESKGPGPTTHNGEVMMQFGEQHGKDIVSNFPSIVATVQVEGYWGDGMPGPEDLQGTWPGKEKKHGETEIKPETQDTVSNCPSIEATAQAEVHWGDGTPIIEEAPGPEDLQGTWPSYVATT
jgi:hypothetical protein